MAKAIKSCNVPDGLHRRLKASAAKAGMSLSGYQLRESKEIAERLTLSELRERLNQPKRVSVAIDAPRLVREERNARDRVNRRMILRYYSSGVREGDLKASRKSRV